MCVKNSGNSSEYSFRVMKCTVDANALSSPPNPFNSSSSEAASKHIRHDQLGWAARANRDPSGLQRPDGRSLIIAVYIATCATAKAGNNSIDNNTRAFITAGFNPSPATAGYIRSAYKSTGGRIASSAVVRPNCKARGLIASASCSMARAGKVSLDLALRGRRDWERHPGSNGLLGGRAGLDGDFQRK